MCGVECSKGSVWLFAFFLLVDKLRVRARSYRLNYTVQMIDPVEALSLSLRPSGAIPADLETMCASYFIPGHGTRCVPTSDLMGGGGGG